MIRQFLGSILFTALMCAAADAQTIRKVPQDFPTIQSAIVASQAGDTVQVSAGVYVENIDFLGKAITVASVSGADVTTIDGGQSGSVVRFTTGETSASVLDGFTIRNGRAVSIDGGGIAIYGSSPTVRHNRILNNTACNGLGIEINFGSPLIQGNLISNNVTQTCSGGGGGGGIHVGGAGAGAAQILDNTISNNSVNSSLFGGGIFLSNAGTILIRGNFITGNAANMGGGLAIANSSNATIVQNVFAGNTAKQGGGIYTGGNPSVTSNTIVDNSASQQGSAIYAISFNGSSPVKNNLIIGKTGQVAFYCTNFNATDPQLLGFNNVFADQAAAYGGSCTDVTGTNGNISAAPLFVDRVAQNFKVLAGSPGIDAGSNLVAGIPLVDIDSFPRILPFGGAIDMGAYEFAAPAIATFLPTSLAFGNQSVGTQSTSDDITVTNTGSVNLFISSVTVSGEFSQTNTCQVPAGIPAGQTCIISVRFAPILGGTRSGQLSITSNSANNTVLNLTGVGIGTLTMDTTPLAFLDQKLGTTGPATALTITNTGTVPLSFSGITTTGDFTSANDCGVSIPAGSSCTASIRFAPTVRGMRSGTIFVNALGSLYAITLSGRGVTPLITLSPSSLSFSNQAPLTTSASQSVTVTNPGDIPLTINSISLSGDFSGSNDCGSALAVNASCTITVLFSPATLGSKTGLLTISDDAIGSPHIMGLSGSSNFSLLTPSLTSVDFGNQAVNVPTTSRLITLRNTGNVTLGIGSVTISGEFSKSGTCPASLNPNTICALFITFTPTTVGPKTGSLSVTSSALGSPLVVPLSGAGADFVFSPSPLSLGDIHIGTAATRTTTLTNNSSNPVNITGISVTAGFTQVNNCGPSLAPGTSCSFDITLAPVTSGLVVSGTLTVTDDAIGSPHTVPLSGRGVVGSIVFSPAALTFDPDLVGTRSASRTLTVTNSGNGALTFSGISVTGDYTQTSNCGATLSAGANCLVNVSFSPAALGIRTGSLTVLSDGTGSPTSASLTGTGLNSLATPVVTGISPDIRAAGSTDLTLTVNGSAFSTLSVVRWGGVERPTTFVTGTTLTATIPASDFATPGTVPVSVFNPSPGGGPSNSAGFVVYGVITLTTKDLVSDNAGNRIYASVPGAAPIRANTITAIDPITGALGVSTAIGTDPGKLAISGDSRVVYVSLDGTGQVRPFDSATQTPGAPFGLGNDPTFGTYYVEDMVVAPGKPETIAISRKNLGISPRHAGVAIYDNGTKRITETPRHTGSNVIAFSALASSLYGYNTETTESGFRTMSVSSSGVETTNVKTGLVTGNVSDIQFEGGRIYTTSGQIIDPVSNSLVATLQLTTPGEIRGVVADASMGRVFFLWPSISSVQILAFDLTTFSLKGSLTLPVTGAISGVGSLVRWGETGLAFRSGTQVFIFEIPLSWLGTDGPGTSLSPSSGQQGQANLNVAVTGRLTNFIQGQTAVSFGAGIVVNSLSVVDASHATANITITNSAVAGLRSVTFANAGPSSVVSGQFTVSGASGLQTSWGNTGGVTTNPTGLFKSIAAGDLHSLAIRTDGTLTGWGNNSSGQINVPLGTFVAIAAGGSHSLAIRSDGTLAGWGNNSNGQINVPQGTFIAIAAGATHSLAIRTDGTLAGWGNNSNGQIDVPEGTFIAIAAGATHSLAIRTEGTLVGWGSNISGEINVPSGSFTAIAAGATYSLALRSNGTMVAWGSNAYGQTNVPSGTFTAIAAGDRNGYAIRPDGTLGSWGDSSTAGAPSGTFRAIASSGSHGLVIGNGLTSSRDFNGDNKSDILWRDSTGKVSVWQMDGFTVTSDTVIANISPDWKVVGSGDFNADGKMDIIWRDSAGNLAVWLMNGASVSSFSAVGNMPASWSIAGLADFNADGKSDILWRNTSGDVALWLMNGATIATSTTIANISPSWSVAGTGDFNADGKADILWRENSGDVSIWLMNGTSIISSTVVANIWIGWSIVGTGDFNADGKADILWRSSSGDVAVWLMNGNAVISTRVIANIWMGWTIAGAGDFNADGRADILWRDGSGNVSIWFMDGTAVLNWAGIGNVADRTVQ